MNPIRGYRLDHYPLPTTGLAWLTLIAAIGTNVHISRTPVGVVPGGGSEVLHFTMASALLLGVACVSVLLVQLMQRRINRTPVLPGLILIYASWVVTTIVQHHHTTRALLPYAPTALHISTMAFQYVLPGLGALTTLVALVMLVLRRPVTRQAWGYGQLYSADPALIERKRPARTMARASSEPESPQRARDTPPRYPASKPRTTFADLYGNDDLKARLRESGQAWKERDSNGVLLFGPPGTGKTAFAEAFAGELGIGFIKVTFGDMVSKWINQSTEQLVQAFAEARAQQPVMLFIDEADALLKSRDGGGNYEEYERMVATFLDKVVDVRGTRVLVVAATNHVDRLDEAAIREGRFDTRIEVPLPDADARRGLIQTCLHTAHCHTDEQTMARLTRRWGGFNVPRLLACGRGACTLARGEAGLPAQPEKREPTTSTDVTYDHFYRALRKIQGRKGGAPEGAKRLAELFLDAHTAERLTSLATQLANVDKIERMGGSLPKGVLFYGPPGTGKTATAMALARESAWSFISCSGRDLLAEGAVDRLSKQANDLRPAIVFIDEADDILGHRDVSAFKSATNELLILIDGAGGMLQDVVWIAATNHPGNMDPAAMRGGRFGQKIEFSAPGETTARRLIIDWVRRKQARQALLIDTSSEDWAQAILPALRDLTPSDIYQVLESANNAAITDNLRKNRERAVTPAHIEQAVTELRG